MSTTSSSIPSATPPLQFPAPVGGVPQPGDFVPSILVAILYACLIPVIAWRLIKPESRNFVLIGTVAFSVERYIYACFIFVTTPLLIEYSHSWDRVVVFALRAQEAHNVSSATSNFFVSYMQTTFGAGYISIGQDLVMVLRAWLVQTTVGKTKGQLDDASFRSPTPDTATIDMEYAPLTANKPQFGSVNGTQSATTTMYSGETIDDPKARFWYRRACGLGTILFWVVDIMALVAGAVYINAEHKASQAQLTQQLR